MGTDIAHFPPLPPGEGKGEFRKISVSKSSIFAFGGSEPDSAVPQKCSNEVRFLQSSLTPTLSRRERGKRAASFAIGILALGAFFCVGCTSSHPTASLVQSPVYAVPAQQLVTDVQKIISSPPISLPVEDKGSGTLLTGWQEPFRGDFHIVRYWHERTRYRITGVPDFSNPAYRSRLQISDESEERPDEGGINAETKKWHPAPNNHRPERSEALLRQIETQLQVPAATRP